MTTQDEKNARNASKSASVADILARTHQLMARNRRALGNRPPEKPAPVAETIRPPKTLSLSPREEENEEGESALSQAEALPSSPTPIVASSPTPAETLPVEPPAPQAVAFLAPEKPVSVEADRISPPEILSPPSNEDGNEKEEVALQQAKALPPSPVEATVLDRPQLTPAPSVAPTPTADRPPEPVSPAISPDEFEDDASDDTFNISSEISWWDALDAIKEKDFVDEGDPSALPLVDAVFVREAREKPEPLPIPQEYSLPKEEPTSAWMIDSETQRALAREHESALDSHAPKGSHIKIDLSTDFDVQLSKARGSAPREEELPPETGSHAFAALKESSAQSDELEVAPEVEATSLGADDDEWEALAETTMWSAFGESRHGTTLATKTEETPITQPMDEPITQPLSVLSLEDILPRVKKPFLPSDKPRVTVHSVEVLPENWAAYTATLLDMVLAQDETPAPEPAAPVAQSATAVASKVQAVAAAKAQTSASGAMGAVGTSKSASAVAHLAADAAASLDVMSSMTSFAASEITLTGLMPDDDIPLLTDIVDDLDVDGVADEA